MKLLNYDEKILKKMFLESGNIEIEQKKPKREIHSGEWITIENATLYSEIGKLLLPETNGQIIGEAREFAIRIMKKYGLNEIEAINVVRGNLLKDIVHRYDKLREKIEKGDIQ